MNTQCSDTPGCLYFSIEVLIVATLDNFDFKTTICFAELFAVGPSKLSSMVDVFNRNGSEFATIGGYDGLVHTGSQTSLVPIENGQKLLYFGKAGKSIS
jgi:hypothetical protein